MQPTKHPDDWKSNTYSSLAVAAKTSAQAGVLREVSLGDISDAGRRTSLAGLASGTALDNWSSTTEGIKTRLEQEHADVQAEIDELTAEHTQASSFTKNLQPGQIACAETGCVSPFHPRRPTVFCRLRSDATNVAGDAATSVRTGRSASKFSTTRPLHCATKAWITFLHFNSLAPWTTRASQSCHDWGMC